MAIEVAPDFRRGCSATFGLAMKGRSLDASEKHARTQFLAGGQGGRDFLQLR